MKQPNSKIEEDMLEDKADITGDNYIEEIVTGNRFVFLLPGASAFLATIILSIFVTVALGGGIISLIRDTLTVPQAAFAQLVSVIVYMIFVFIPSAMMMLGKKKYAIVMEYYTKTVLIISLILLAYYGFENHELNPMFLGGAIINAIILRLIYTSSYFVYTELSYRLHKRRREVASEKKGK